MLIHETKRWLILTQYYHPEIGAPQIRLRSLTKELRRLGYIVQVVTAMPNYPAGRIFPEYRGRLFLREELDGVVINRTWVYAATGKSAFKRLANYFSFTFLSLFVVLFGERPDVMFVESQPLSLGVVGVLMKWLRGVPYIYNVPDLQVDVAEQVGFLRNRKLLNLALNLENFFLRHSWKVSTVTHGFIEHFVSRGIPRAQVTFLPNGADSEFLRPKPPARTLLDRWHLGGKKVFLYVGTHAFYHGLDTLIECASLLRDHADICFLLIGDGPERPRLETRARELGLTNVVFGRSPYDERDSLYSITWASLALLKNIAVARKMRLAKVFPSLSCAVPVVYSGVGEMADLLLAEGCGIVVPPESPAELADAILKLAAEPDRRNEMGSRGRDLVEKEYSWRAIVENWIAELGSNSPHRLHS